MFCPSCGHQLVADAAFCQACGARQPDTGVLAEAAAVAAAAVALPSEAVRPDAGSQADLDVSPRPTSVEEERVIPVAARSTPLPRRSARRLGLYLGLTGILLLISTAIAVGVVYVKGLVDQRDTALETAQLQIDDLSTANVAFQSQVNDLTAARDHLTSDLATRTNERDSARSERDTAQATAASLQQDLDASKKQVGDLQGQISDSQKQLDQARQDSSNQQQRANNSDARSTAIAAVLQLDDQIYSDFYNFLSEVNTMDQAVKRNDYFNAAAAYSRAQVVAGRLDNLFNQRKAALAKV